MTKYPADLHIHTCLSACADKNMTPCTIVQEAMSKGLEVIAITDHNSALNLPAAMVEAKNTDILIIPGIEVETREEIHLLCYFPDVNAALIMSKMLYNALPEIYNFPEWADIQCVIGEDGQISAEVKKLMVVAVRYSLDEVVDMCEKLGGVSVPAHVNRELGSMLTVLGEIPKKHGLRTVELYTSLLCPDYIIKKDFNIIFSSDAHSKGDMLPAKHFIELREKSIDAFLEFIRNKSNQ